MIRVPAVPEKNIKNAAAEHPGDRKCSVSRQQKNRQNQCRAVRICAAAPAFISISFEQLPLSIFLLPDRQPPGTDP